VAANAQFVFDTLGWFARYRPPLFVLLIAAAYLPTLFSFRLVRTPRAIGTIVLYFFLFFLLTLFSLLMTGLNVALFVYLTYEVGWAFFIYEVLAVIGLLSLHYLQRWADHLSSRMLAVIFAVPGVVAVVIGFFTNFPDLLRIVPIY
jgi:hypothetical protein